MNNLQGGAVGGDRGQGDIVVGINEHGAADNRRAVLCFDEAHKDRCRAVSATQHFTTLAKDIVSVS